MGIEHGNYVKRDLNLFLKLKHLSLTGLIFKSSSNSTPS
jgi:hypothetical protein